VRQPAVTGILYDAAVATMNTSRFMIGRWTRFMLWTLYPGESPRSAVAWLSGLRRQHWYRFVRSKSRLVFQRIPIQYNEL